MMAASAPKQASLLGLPAEIRIEIYGFVVKDRYHVAIPRCRVVGLRITDTKYTFKEPALATVNHQLRAETLPIFFSENTFDFFYTLSKADEPIPRLVKHWSDSAQALPAAKNMKTCYIPFKWLVSGRTLLKVGSITASISPSEELIVSPRGERCICEVQLLVADINAGKARLLLDSQILTLLRYLETNVLAEMRDVEAYQRCETCGKWSNPDVILVGARY